MRTCAVCSHGHEQVPVQKRIGADSWLTQDRFEEFRAAYARACGWTMPALSLAKVSAEDAYWIWHAITAAVERPLRRAPLRDRRPRHEAPARVPSEVWLG